MKAVKSMDDTRRYEAVVARDKTREGAFVFGVRTTGVFCRPGCGARTPRRENVAFFDTPSQAFAAGFRPCKRCRPLEGRATPPAWVGAVFERIERSNARVSPVELRRAGVHPVRATRWFQEHLGMSLHAFQHSLRLGASVDRLREGAPVGEAAAESGFESESGFRDAFRRALGDAPTQLDPSVRVVRVRRLVTPLGDMLVGVRDEGVCLLEFIDPQTLPRQLGALRKALGPALSMDDHPLLARAARELERYFAGELRQFTLPLHAPGTPFEQRVWAELLRIEYGRTWSYAQLARSIGRPSAFRAVAGANGRNRIAILIPCHRVIASDGGLGGYAGAVWRKQRLLELERENAG
jgi:AraC family transcriptional regulator of adaptative response/methylated-DNA-[protein]-cysteine methyltransferase